MAHEFVIRRTVEWVDTDSARIVHFSNFFRHMEQAEHEFFRSVGLSIHIDINGQTYTFPRVHAEADFIRPLRFEDDFEVHLLVRQVRTRAIEFDFLISQIDGKAKVPAAAGSITTVCITRDEHDEMKSVEIPPLIRDKIQPAPPKLLAERDKFKRLKKD